MKFRTLKPRSSRVTQNQRIQTTIREILKIERGDKCEICGTKSPKSLGVFHIMPVSTHPRLRFSFENILLAGWMDCAGKCHFTWHKNYFKAQEINKKIQKLRGDDYIVRLSALHATTPRLDKIRVGMIEVGLKAHLEKLKNGKK